VAETDPPLLGVLAAVLKRVRGCRFLYYCQDLYPDVAEATGGVANPLLLGILRRANRWAYARADGIVVLGQDMRARLLAKGVAPDRVTVVPNWADVDRIRPLACNRFRARFGDKFVVMYSGNLGWSQDLELVLRAGERLRSDERVHFVLIGEGAKKESLRELAREAGLTNVEFLPYQPKELLAESLGAADIHLVPLRRGLAGCLVPSKVYSVLAAGRAFLAIMEEEAEVALLARQRGVGIVVPPDDVEALVVAVRWCMDNPRELAEMGRRGRRLAEECYSRRAATRLFEREAIRAAEASPLASAAESS
jgi:glycosyltransferase involved in cell wall biosynthesis